MEPKVKVQFKYSERQLNLRSLLARSENLQVGNSNAYVYFDSRCNSLPSKEGSPLKPSSTLKFTRCPWQRVTAIKILLQLLWYFSNNKQWQYNHILTLSSREFPSSKKVTKIVLQLYMTVFSPPPPDSF